MKKAALILTLIMACVLLTSCGTSSEIGDQFIKISNYQTNLYKDVELCYDKNTMAVYIVYYSLYRFGISPYIMFDKYDRPTVGKWNGKEIVPVEPIKGNMGN